MGKNATMEKVRRKRGRCKVGVRGGIRKLYMMQKRSYGKRLMYLRRQRRTFQKKKTEEQRSGRGGEEATERS